MTLGAGIGLQFSRKVGAGAAPFVGILDSYTVGAAYSVRKLRSAYAGNCVRIRRSSDNAEQDFGFVSNVIDTAGIASFIGGGSGYLVTNYDQSGNAINVTQATAAKQPLYVASGFGSGSKPTIRCDGANHVLKNASVNITSLMSLAPNQVTFVLVQKQDGASDYSAYVGWEHAVSTERVYFTQYGGGLYWDVGRFDIGRINVSEPVGWDNVAHVVELYATTAGVEAIIMDGATVVSGSPALSGGVPASSTGEFGIYGGVLSLVSYLYKGDVSEIFILKTDVGSTARATIRADIGTYYGITVA